MKLRVIVYSTIEIKQVNRIEIESYCVQETLHVSCFVISIIH